MILHKASISGLWRGRDEWFRADLRYIKYMVVFVEFPLTPLMGSRYGSSPLTPRRIFDPSRDLCTTTGCFCCTVQITFYPHPPLILREPQHERPRPHRGRLGKNLIKGEGMERSHIIQFLGSPSRASGQASTSLMPRRIFDRASRTPRPWGWSPTRERECWLCKGLLTEEKCQLVLER